MTSAIRQSPRSRSQSAMTATRNIIIVDDAPLIQAGLSAALKSEGFDVVGQAATAL